MASPDIHPTAVVEDGATIEAGARLGPYCVVGAGARVSEGAELKSHVVVEGRVSIGPRTVVYPFTTLGGPPQHLKALEDDAELVIGADAIIREQASIHLATKAGGGVTRIGDRAFVMAAAHIGHDCQIGNDAVVASNASLGGHVVLEEHAVLGGATAIHQFVRIGAFAHIGGGSAVDRDVVPYASAFGNRARVRGPNLIGLKRRGLSRDQIRAVQAAFEELFGAGETRFVDRVLRVAENRSESSEVKRILEFIERGGSRSVLGAQP
ncbi:MAG: acyl-ACP--UDP-N-acetylglucosamine O-acyltransferase [Pseudomonadota bacterium]